MSAPVCLPKIKHTATVIFLHGLGDTGHGWLSALEEIALPHVKYMCPNAPIQKVTLNGGMAMPSWFDIDSLSFDANVDEKGIKKSSDILKKLVAEEEKNGIPADRIIVGGFSQGGAVALHTFITSEKKLAGCIGLSTFLPMHKKFKSLCKDVNKETNIFLGHGNADPVVNYRFGVMSNELLKSYYKNVSFNTYEGMQHTSNPREIADMKGFLSKVLPKTD